MKFSMNQPCILQRRERKSHTNQSRFFPRRGLILCVLLAFALAALPAAHSRVASAARGLSPSCIVSRASGLFGPGFFFPGPDSNADENAQSPPGSFTPPGQSGGSDENAQSPFGLIPLPGEGNSQFREPPETTTLYAMPSARSVKSGETLTIDYDLALSASDESKIAVIEQGATLEYTLSWAKDEQGEAYEDRETGSVAFSMNRAENERCTLTLRPTPERSSILLVRAKMIFADGTSVENTSDRILVYTEEEIRSHVYTQSCNAGETIDAVFMVLGPEGPWQFTCYASCSLDGGQTWNRADSPLLTFTLNSHEREPDMNVKVAVEASENCLYRIEADVVLPDGVQMVHATDAVRVSAEAVSL